MKIGLIGYGKMGKAIELVAKKSNHQIVARIHPHGDDLSCAKEADLCIDFSHPDCIMDHIEMACTNGITLVVGTTGWDEHREQVKQMVEKASIGFLYSPNFSIGLNIFLKIIDEAARLVDRFDEYDISGMEAHHKQKADSPSGTAKMIAKRLIDKVKRKHRVLFDTPEGPLCDDEIHFPCLRCGSIPGMQKVILDSPHDTITLTHEARDRLGYAQGAVKAAEWLMGKRGFFTLEEVIQ